MCCVNIYYCIIYPLVIIDISVLIVSNMPFLFLFLCVFCAWFESSRKDIRVSIVPNIFSYINYIFPHFNNILYQSLFFIYVKLSSKMQLFPYSNFHLIIFKNNNIFFIFNELFFIYISYIVLGKRWNGYITQSSKAEVQLIMISGSIARSKCIFYIPTDRYTWLHKEGKTSSPSKGVQYVQVS